MPERKLASVDSDFSNWDEGWVRSFGGCEFADEFVKFEQAAMPVAARGKSMSHMLLRDINNIFAQPFQSLWPTALIAILISSVRFL